MSYAAYLRDLLRPIGIYALEEGTLSGAEVEALGDAFDQVEAQAETAQRESILATAEDQGLSRREALFARRPAAPTTELRRAAIAALMQIGADSFSPEAINSAITGCGIRAQALEMGEGHIRIIFPDVAGVPEDFEQIQKIILDIIPCHLETEFYFRYLTWAECEAAGWTWERVESAGHTWHSFELAV